ncbi:MAG: thioredoxin domain-containing protein [Candidatus Peribacteraceae bacterium]|nr:thioredoxin domain-containing protein [Candidatus Peribacteraceae bacterium]MDD5742252.1 thioredoxin domain-containing protein [Candidatus Peribacteraceae bacterium]
MRKITFLTLSCGILLAACTLPSPPAQQQQNASSSSSSESAAFIELQGEEIGEGMPATEERTESGALAERFLATGILEVGNAHAPLTLLMITEHHCSYCRQFLFEIFPRLKTDFLDPGTLKLEIAMLPLQKYQKSTDASIGFICSAAQGKGLVMHDALFRNPNKSKEAILSYAVDLKLSTALLDDCMKSARTKMLLESQQIWAQSLGVEVVPTFFLNGEKFIGLPYYSDLKGRITEALKQQKEQEE